MLNVSKEEYKPARLTFSPFTILDSGLDISVYGQAGAGKTTTLNQYAAYLISKKIKNVLYIRLNTLVDSYEKRRIGEFEKSLNLVKWAILVSKSIDITKDAVIDLNKFLISCTVLIVDGLDEVYSTMPKIIESLNEFKKLYPDIQIITSSRDCVSYLDEIKFLGITLLPFTPNQLDSFVKSYFDDAALSKRLCKKIKSKELYDVISNPLLATVACELVKQGIDSFSNENEIYDCRKKLLLGAYDSVKNVNRTIHTYEQLGHVAERLALSMHQSGIRQLSFENALERITSHSASNRQLNKSILEELINPCNFIFKDPITELLSFGHFRFQEHLVAEMISKDRSIKFIEICRETFWSGALVLFAKNKSIEFLFDELGPLAQEDPAISSTLHLMSSKSAIKNNRNLKDLITINEFYHD
ncbi:MAG: AAA family ATPase [Glaciecola sp.]